MQANENRPMLREGTWKNPKGRWSSELRGDGSWAPTHDPPGRPAASRSQVSKPLTLLMPALRPQRPVLMYEGSR